MTVMGGEFAALIAFGWFAHRLFRQRRQRLTALEVQPPDCGKLLRPPGHWLQEKLLTLMEQQHEQLTSAALWTVLCGVGEVRAAQSRVIVHHARPNSSRQVPEASTVR